MERNKGEQTRYERSTMALEVLGNEDFKGLLNAATGLYRRKLEESHEEELVRLSARETKSFDSIAEKLRILNQLITSGVVTDLRILDDRNTVNPTNGKRKVTTLLGGNLIPNVVTNQVLFSVQSTDIEIEEEAKIAKSIRGINPAQIFHGDRRSEGFDTDFRLTVGIKEITKTEEGIVVSDFTGVSFSFVDDEVVMMQGVTTKAGMYHYSDDLLGDIDTPCKLPTDVVATLYNYGNVSR